jgi:hypothetical protein
MRAIALLCTYLCLCALPAVAQNSQGQNNNNQGGGHHGAPAPLIGAGIPALLGVGGVLLGRKLLKRK